MSLTANVRLGVTVGAAAAFIYILMTFLSRWVLKIKGRNAPGPKGWPVLGNALDLSQSDGNLVPIFNKWAKEFGPIVQFDILGQKQVIVSTDKISNDLFVRRGTKYSGRGTPYAMRYISRDMNPALMPRNEDWRLARKLLHNAMSITVNDKYQEFMVAESTLALRDLLVDEKANFMVAEKAFKRYSYGVLARSMLGIEVESAEDPFIVDTDKLIDIALEAFRPDVFPVNVFHFLRFMPTWFLPSLSAMERLRDDVYKNTWSVRKRVETSIQNGTAKPSIYHHFLQNREEYAITDEGACFAFDSIIGGGTRSPYNGLLTFLYLMMEYPEWQRRLQEHVDEVVGPNRMPSFMDISGLPLVRAIVKEGIRYRSVTAELGIPHQLDEDDTYEGYHFSKGTIFHANYSAILMEKDIYPDQKLFNPERWLDPSYPTYKEPLSVYPNCQNYASFGYGRRACPGYDLAERTLVIMVARVAWACNIKKPIDPVTKKPVVINMTHEPTPNPKPHPFPCEILPRSKDKVSLIREEARKL